MNLDPYFQTEGLAYRIVPIRTTNKVRGEIGRIDTKIMYENLMNKFKWGNIEDEHVYLDENNLRMLSNYRNSFSRLADALLEEGKKDSAIQVINRCLELMPGDRIPYNYFILPVIETMLNLGMDDQAINVAHELINKKKEEIDFYLSLSRNKVETIDYEIRLAFHILQEMLRLAEQYNVSEMNEDLDMYLQNNIMRYSSMMN